MGEIRALVERACWSVRLAFALAWMVVLVVGCGTEPAPPSAASAVVDDTATPTAIRIPSIGVDGDDIIPLGLQADGSMQVPPLSKPMQAGWYCPEGPPKCGAPTPGEVGPAVVAGHINGNGKPGIFAKLAQVKAGATVEVDRSDNQVAVFKVSEVLIVDKADFPTNRVYSNTTGAELRLITCGPNDLDRVNHRYLDQTIAFAKLVEIKPKNA